MIYNLKKRGLAPCTIKSFTLIATKSIPIVSNLLISFAISIFVPTPSVQATIFGSFKFFGIFEIDPNPPMLLNFFALLFDDMADMNFINLSAALMSTPLFYM